PQVLHSFPTRRSSDLWIEGQDSPIHEIEEELAFRVVTGISKRRLREIVRPEGEELRVLRDLVRRERCPRELDHRPEFVGYGNALDRKSTRLNSSHVAI